MTTNDTPTTNASNPSYQSLDQLSAAIPPIAWLWPGWIPRAMITLLCAAPGAGKSLFALDLAHRLIAGLPWPDGTLQSGAPSTASTPTTPNVIYLDAEDAPQLLCARAAAWGMDCTHLYPMLPEPGAVLDLTNPACQERLLAMADALQPALVIVDSLGSVCRGAEYQVSTVDSLFRCLHRVAVQSRAAVLVIHHLRKRGPVSDARLTGGSLDSEDVRGSGHLVSLARSVIGLAAVPDVTAVQLGLDAEPNTPRRLQLLKTNLGPYLGPLRATLQSSPAGGVQLAYAPDPGSHRPRTAVESCARWLLDSLKAEGLPIGPRRLERRAQMAGYSRATLFRARELLGPRIVDTIARHAVGNEWALPEWPPRKRCSAPRKLDTPK